MAQFLLENDNGNGHELELAGEMSSESAVLLMISAGLHLYEMHRALH